MLQTDNLKQIERARNNPPVLTKLGNTARALLKAPSGELTASSGDIAEVQFRSPPAEIEQFPRKRQAWYSRHYKSVLFLIVAVLPTVAAIVYYCFVATPQYVTEFYVGIGMADPTLSTLAPSTGGAGGGGANLLGGSSLGETIVGLDSYVVTQFIQSREMADLLNKQVDARKLFSGGKVDFLSRLNPKAPEEDFANYWQNMSYAYFDLTTGAIDVQVRAFTPQDSLNIANAVLKNASQRVSDMRDKARADELRAATQDVASNERRVVKARETLRELRNNENIFDPTERVTAVSTTADKIRDDIAGMEAQERAFASDMSPNSPVLTVLKARIAASKAQLKIVEDQITNKLGGKDVLAAVVNRFNEATAEESFAENAYQGALQALELARNTANREQVFLVNYIKPSLPQTSIYPNVPKSVALVAAFALIAWLLLSIVIQSIRDHVI